MSVPKRPDCHDEDNVELRDEMAALEAASISDLLALEERDPDQAWFWTEEWQKGEREAEEDIREGRVKGFDTMEELLADLNSNYETE